MHNDPYSNFHLEARFWGQNNKNLHNFGATIDTVVMIERQAIYVKANIMTKICFYRTSLNRITQLSVCSYGYTFIIVTKKITTLVSLTGSIY